VCRESVETVNDLVATSGHRGAILGELNGNHDQSNVLGSVGLE
jgi:hypothetical protein